LQTLIPGSLGVFAFERKIQQATSKRKYRYANPMEEGKRKTAKYITHQYGQFEASL